MPQAKWQRMVLNNQVKNYNLQAEVLNSRVRETLATALGVNVGSAESGWQEWASYNELYLPERPVVSLDPSYSHCPYTHYTVSCFSPGTPVWTEAGAVPIEKIAVGDMVLAQHPTTGELAYRPVNGVTIRPPSPMARVDVGGESINATLGHRFWVNGAGWKMAKELKAHEPLHSLVGYVAAESVDPVPNEEVTEAYNLMVDDFHTYFVGYTRLLVHDNTCPQPTTAVVPGLVLSPEAATEANLNNVAAQRP
jgi:hypothetical protein